MSSIDPLLAVHLFLSYLSQSRCYIHLRWSCFIGISPILCVSIDICWVALFYLILLPSLICASCTASKGRCNQNTAINPIPWFILAKRKNIDFQSLLQKNSQWVGIFLLIWYFLFGLGLVLCGEWWGCLHSTDLK